MRVIYFDCFSGISGDMTLGALFDLGLSVEALRSELGKLGIAGWEISSEAGMRAYMAGTRALVHAPEQQQHRHLADIRQILEQSQLDAAIKAKSLRIFELLADAEGRVHGISAEQVHFHEVGALDAIVDVVGVVIGLALLGVEQVYASALPLGSGWVRAAHGQIPVPAPATLLILAGCQAPITSDTTPGELVTPTGAALLAGLATFRRPAMRIERVGHGLGGRNPAERPNLLRAWLGELLESPQPTGGHHVQQHDHQHQHGHHHEHAPTATQPSVPILLETNIDDQPAEQIAYTAERLLALGALDVWMQPIQMKKGRPGVLLAALVPAHQEASATQLILRETSTFGIRRRVVERHVAERAFEQIETPWGPVQVKRKYWQAEDLGAAPEYEQCARIAREQGLALRDIYRVVAELAQRPNFS
ncbi:MAG: nickel pincer cofactor biosynthesis protein LarC [Roseiflexaceae bacterium]